MLVVVHISELGGDLMFMNTHLDIDGPAESLMLA